MPLVLREKGFQSVEHQQKVELEKHYISFCSNYRGHKSSDLPERGGGEEMVALTDALLKEKKWI